MRDSAPCCKKWGSPSGTRRRRRRLRPRPSPQPLLHPRRRRRSPPQPPRRGPDAPATPAAPAAPPAPAPAKPPAAATPVAERPRAGRRTSPAPARHGDAAAPPAAGATPVALTPRALKLHPAQAPYPPADPAQTPAGLGSGWLIVAESLTPAEPLGGAAGRLLDNMLRAMQLHRHPRVFLAALERPGPGQLVSRHRSDVVGCAQ